MESETSLVENTQGLNILLEEVNKAKGGDSPAALCDDNIQLSGLISSFLTATEGLAEEVKKDICFEKTVTESLKATECPKFMEANEGNLLKALSPESEYLDSFNISVDEERTAASYVELLRSYQDVYQKWQAAEIQSQLKDMKIQDMKNDNSDLEAKIKQLSNSQINKKNHDDEFIKHDNESRWKETLKELEEKRKMYDLLKERQEEINSYKEEKESLEEEVCELKKKQGESKHKLEVERKENARLEATLKSSQNERIKDTVILNEKIEEIKLLKERLQRKSEEEINLRNKINLVEKLKVEHNDNVIMKNKKIETLMKQIIELAEINKALRSQQLENETHLESNDGVRENSRKEAENKDQDREEKERAIRRLREELRRSENMVQEGQTKLQLSRENVEGLLKKLRAMEIESEKKREDIEILRKEVTCIEAKNRLLEENLTSVRDENVRIKNARKVVGESDIEKIYQEIHCMKKEMTKQIKAIGINNLNQKRDDGNNPPQETLQADKRYRVDNRVRNERRSKRKPNQSDCSISPVNEKESEFSTSDDERESESERNGRWQLVSGRWEQLPVVPGEKTYSDVLKANKKNDIKMQRTLIISTSITRGIRDDRFKNCYEGGCKFHRIHGGKAKHIKEDIEKNLPSGECSSVILQMGGNDIQDGYYPEKLTSIANTIVETGNVCRKKGAETVFIAGVPVRRYEYTWERCKDLNRQLKELCRDNGFVFIDNSNITHTDHLDYDGVHLNRNGDKLLANNYLDCLRRKFFVDN